MDNKNENKEKIIQEIRQLVESSKQKILIYNYQKELSEKFSKEDKKNHLEILIKEKDKNSQEIKELFRKTEKLMEKWKKMQ